MRIGTNHGSLSDRIMNRYGDTPIGMVESALEFARIARDLGYHDFMFSMKSSNPKVMIEAYRLLVAKLWELEVQEAGVQDQRSVRAVSLAPNSWLYPIHLGVTEAGDGEDGRIKSAIGIGSLLNDGIGDTIRVSLTEDSVHEIPSRRRSLLLSMRAWAPWKPARISAIHFPTIHLFIVGARLNGGDWRCCPRWRGNGARLHLARKVECARPQA
jgi:(E)-4-hydroxy-3-methylbut-2-enyl-diphosphate synthase